MKKILSLIFFLFFISIFSDQLFKNLDRFKDSIWFDLEIKSPVDGYVQLFYNESKSNPITLNIQKSESFKKYSIELSEINIQKLRLNPVISTEEVFYQNFSIRTNREIIILNSLYEELISFNIHMEEHKFGKEQLTKGFFSWVFYMDGVFSP